MAVWQHHHCKHKHKHEMRNKGTTLSLQNQKWAVLNRAFLQSRRGIYLHLTESYNISVKLKSVAMGSNIMSISTEFFRQAMAKCTQPANLADNLFFLNIYNFYKFCMKLF